MHITRHTLKRAVKAQIITEAQSKQLLDFLHQLPDQLLEASEI